MFTDSIIAALCKFYSDNNNCLLIEGATTEDNYLVVTTTRRTHSFAFVSNQYLTVYEDNTSKVERMRISYTSDTAKIGMDLTPLEDGKWRAENYTSVVDMDTIMDELCILQLMGGQMAFHLAA
jgi:hypothetical protein